MDRDVGAQVPRAVARAQVLDREHAARHEAAERDDRHRHVHVEDLLHEALVGVERRVEEDQRERRRERDRRWRPPAGRGPSSTSVLQQEVEDGYGEKHEHHIVEGEQPEPARRGPPGPDPGASAARWPGRTRSAPAPAAAAAAAARSARARASRRPARPPARPPPRCPRSPSAGSPAAPAACRRGPGPSSSRPNAGTATSSTATRNRNSALALARNSAVRSTGASSSASMPPCSRSAANSRVHPDHRGQQQRHPEHPGGERAVERVAVEAEVEQHVDGDREQRHRRHRLLRAQLEQQVLAQDRQRGARSSVELVVRRHRPPAAQRAARRRTRPARPRRRG